MQFPVLLEYEAHEFEGIQIFDNREYPVEQAVQLIVVPSELRAIVVHPTGIEIHAF